MLTEAQAELFTTILYNFSLATSKISILLLYIRVLTSYDNFRRVAWGLLVIVAIFSVAMFATLMTACIPLNKYWDRDVEGYCHLTSVWWGLAGFNIGSDFLIFFLPMPVIIGTTLPMRQKLGLLGVFAIGFFICLISILRVVWLQNLTGSDDFTYDNSVITEWSCIEINMAIVCACLVTLKPLCHKLFAPHQPRMTLDAEPVDYERPATIGCLLMRPTPGEKDLDIYEWPSRPGATKLSPKTGTAEWPSRPGMVQWPWRSPWAFSDQGTVNGDSFIRIPITRESGPFRFSSSPTLTPTLLPKSLLADVKKNVMKDKWHQSHLVRLSVISGKSGNSGKSASSYKVW